MITMDINEMFRMDMSFLFAKFTNTKQTLIISLMLVLMLNHNSSRYMDYLPSSKA